MLIFCRERLISGFQGPDGGEIKKSCIPPLPAHKDSKSICQGDNDIFFGHPEIFQDIRSSAFPLNQVLSVRT
jgi:hypothetical protein